MSREDKVVDGAVAVSDAERDVQQARKAQDVRRKSPELKMLSSSDKGPLHQLMRTLAPECDDKTWHGTWFRKKDYKSMLQQGYEPAGLAKNDGHLVEHADMVMMRLPMDLYKEHLKIAPAISRKMLGDKDVNETNNPAKVGEELTITRPGTQ